MECDGTFSCLSLHVHFRWGVAPVEKFSTGGILGEDNGPKAQM